AVARHAVDLEVAAGVIADIIDANGVDVVQDAHLAGRVPPQLAQPVETIDVLPIDARGMGMGVILRHANLFFSADLAGARDDLERSARARASALTCGGGAVTYTPAFGRMRAA